MPHLTPPPASPRQRRPLSSLWRDRRGVSAVEFALITPVLLLFYFGMAELTEALMAQRRVSIVASSVGDVVARTTQLTDAQRTDLFNIGGVLMAPFSTTTLRMCIVSISSDANGKDTVDWSESYNSPANCPAAKAVLTTIPTSVLGASQSVIMSKTSYDFTSPMKLVIPTSFTISRTYYLRPRLSDKVTRVS